ncbi:AAA family ATPase [Sorangium sp. So ce1024]|uniref:AAA family ATPase n=1 Tax=unclassified Sorangium TaxID=2621164 RepID=UPI003F0E4400
MSLEAFGVKNLRCLTDTGLVPIRPITVLVGRNSSGKSTFLRAFPLLRQSVETPRDSPILWYHERYVDFGSLKDAASSRLSEPEVTFQFRLRLPEQAEVALGDPAFDIAVTLAGGETPHVRGYEIHAEGHVVRWELDATGRLLRLVANDETIQTEAPLSLGTKSYLLPTLQPGTEPTLSYHQVPEGLVPEAIDYQTKADTVLLEPLAALLVPYFHGNTSADTIDGVANELFLGKRSAMLKRLVSLSDHTQFQKRVGGLQLGDDEFERIASAAAARISPYIIEAADLVLADLMSRVAYLKPLRVSPERAYRIQNLAVDEVDPDGKNLPMFLRSLSTPEAEDFARFTQATLNFETKVRTTGIHAEILVKEGPAKGFVNLVDVGFGYSEVLPLAAALWSACIRPRMQKRAPAPLVAIEQPELHLHPAAQAKLARMLVEAVSGSGSKIIVETHSESLINGLGKLIHEGHLKAEDVQIVLFDKDEETGEAEVRLAGYRDSGALHDWPYGFLSPVADRRVRAAAE